MSSSNSYGTVESPHAEEFIETILSNERARPPGSERAEKANQAIAVLINLLGKKHTIAILHQFPSSDGPLRFSNLEAAIDIAPNTLSNRLEELTDAGLLTRKAYNEIPPRVEYDTTEKAKELVPVFWYLRVWAERHGLQPTSPAENIE